MPDMNSSASEVDTVLMEWIIKKQARDGSGEIGKVAGERFDHKEDAEYLAALLAECSSTHKFWADAE